jgi:hypothetical protein
VVFLHFKDKTGKLSKKLVIDSKLDAEEIFQMLDELYKNPVRVMK